MSSGIHRRLLVGVGRNLVAEARIAEVNGNCSVGNLEIVLWPTGFFTRWVRKREEDDRKHKSAVHAFHP